MIDYVLVNRRFRTSVPDTRVYRSTFHESDHELVVSALRLKIKAKRRHTGSPRYQTTNVSTSHQAGYQLVLAESFDKFDQPSSINAQWESFKSSIQKLVSPFHLHQELVTLIGSPMKSTTCPGRMKKLGFV